MHAITAYSAVAARFAKLALGILTGSVIVSMFLIVPQYVGLGDAGRIIIMHVPAAWVTTLAFAVSALYSIRYVRRRNPTDDASAVAAAEVGFLFCALATATGSVFAQIVWGVFWNWDPRETSILVLLLIYAAYFALRSAIDEPERRMRLSAVYNLFAAVTMPFLLFVAPRIADSTLHPNCAFIQGSRCNGIQLSLRDTRVGQLGDVVLELKGLEQRGQLAVAQVEVRTPGLRSVQLLEPTFSLEDRRPADRPAFTGQQFMLALEVADLTNGTVKLNIQAPGTGLLSNGRTLWTFLLANIAFAGLFVWLFRLRVMVLELRRRLV